MPGFGDPNATASDLYNLPFGMRQGSYPTMSQYNSGSFYRDIYGSPQATPSTYLNGGGGFGGNNSFGDLFAQSSGGSRGGFSSGSSGDINNSWGGSGGGFDFGNGTPSGYNPYQFMPSFQQFQRPDSPVAGETPEEEFLRQYTMGQLLGDQPGRDAAYNMLYNTVNGDYLSPESNPFLGQQINAIGEDTANQLNRSVNDILSRAGTGGALGGSRSALMQGTAAGEATRGFNTNVTNMLNENYQRERGLQLGAVPGLLQTEGLPIQQSLQAMQLAGVPREFQQQLINAQMQEWLRQQSERYLPVQVGQSVMGQRMGQQIPIVQPQQNWMQGLGSLAQGAGSLASGARTIGSLFGGSSTNPMDIYASDSAFNNGLQGGMMGNYSLADSGLGGDLWAVE